MFLYSLYLQFSRPCVISAKNPIRFRPKCDGDWCQYRRGATDTKCRGASRVQRNYSMASSDRCTSKLLVGPERTLTRWKRTFLFLVSNRRCSVIGGRLTQRHSRSSFLRSSARAATLACSQNPAALPTPLSNGSSHVGSFYILDTLRPCCGPMAMHLVIGVRPAEPRGCSIGPVSGPSPAR